MDLALNNLPRLICHKTKQTKSISRKTSLEKYLPLSLLQGFEKGYSRFACERVLEIKHNYNILTPTLMAVNVVSFSFSWCSTGGPGVHSAGWWLSLPHLISNFSGPQTPSGFPRAPSAGCSFPYHISSYSDWNLNSTATRLEQALDFRLDCVI